MTNKYKNSDKVRVSNGVIDPDFGTKLKGWSGEITEIELMDNGSWLYCIVWDVDTLQMLDDDYISKSEDANLDYERIYLEEGELELIEIGDQSLTGMFIA